MLDRDDDIESIIELARLSHAESRFGYIPFSGDKVRKVVEKALENEKRQGVFFAYKGEVLVGFAYCSIGEYHIGTDVLLTTIHNINVAKDVRHKLDGGRVALGLFKGIESWSQARGAKEVLFHVSSGIDLGRAHKLAKRMGFTFIGGSYAKNTR
jgi:hypothetical protein